MPFPAIFFAWEVNGDAGMCSFTAFSSNKQHIHIPRHCRVMHVQTQPYFTATDNVDWTSFTKHTFMILAINVRKSGLLHGF